MRRRLLKEGSSYSVKLPADLGKKVEEIFLSRQFELDVSSDGTITISPPSELQHSQTSIELESDDPVDLETAIFAAYMRGYDSLSVKVPKDAMNSISRIRELVLELHGMSLRSDSSTSFTITFSDPMEGNFNAIVSRAHRLIREAYKENFSLITSDERGKVANPTLVRVSNLEDDMDKLSFYFKRLANKTLLSYKVYQESGLRDKRDIMNYITIMTASERIGDIEKEICQTLVEIIKKNPIDLGGLADYYTQVHALLDRAYRSVRDGSEVTELLGAKKRLGEGGMPEFYENILPFEVAGKVYEIAQSHPDLHDELMSISSKLFGLIGIATNIAEASRNISIFSAADNEKMTFWTEGHDQDAPSS